MSRTENHINLKQFIRFAVTGLINTTVNFLIFNILVKAFGIIKNDPKYILYVLISSVVAVFNSYLINKYWVFKASNNPIYIFLLVSGFGILLNAFISTTIFLLGHNFFPGVSVVTLGNIGIFFGIIVVTITNFTGYKFLVFKI